MVIMRASRIDAAWAEGPVDSCLSGWPEPSVGYAAVSRFAADQANGRSMDGGTIGRDQIYLKI